MYSLPKRRPILNHQSFIFPGLQVQYLRFEGGTGVSLEGSRPCTPALNVLGVLRDRRRAPWDRRFLGLLGLLGPPRSASIGVCRFLR